MYFIEILNKKYLLFKIENSQVVWWHYSGYSTGTPWSCHLIPYVDRQLTRIAARNKIPADFVLRESHSL